MTGSFGFDTRNTTLENILIKS